MTVTLEHDTITEPGVYDDLDEQIYHAHKGSLSVSGAKLLLPPSCPAKFAYARDHGRPPNAAFDFGHAAHKMVLGIGAELVVVEGTGKAGPDTWATNADKELVAAARERGAVPLRPSEMAAVEGMAEAIRRDPRARMLLEQIDGKPEQSMFWTDDRTGITRRARVDRLPAAGNGRMVLVDYKSAVAADDESCRKALYNYGYAMQADWYLDGVRTLGLDQDPEFLFIFQEKTAPYLVNVVGIDENAHAYGRARNTEAIDIYAKCTADDTWPGYGNDINYLSLPAWVERRFLED